MAKSNSAPATTSPFDGHVVFGQMPAARADHQHRGIVADRIMLAAVRVGVVEPAEPVIAQVHLALDQLVPHRRGRVLEIGHERLRAAVERVDQHLGVGRAGDLDAAVQQVARGWRRPSTRPRGCRASPRGKSGSSPASNRACRSCRASSSSRRRDVEPLVQLGEEVERASRQHLARAADCWKVRQRSAAGRAPHSLSHRLHADRVARRSPRSGPGRSAAAIRSAPSAHRRRGRGSPRCRARCP